MSLLLPDFGLIFWMTLSFGIVFFLLAKYGFPVIVRSVENRREYIDKSISAANEANRQLAGVEARKEALLNEAKTQRAAIMREAEKARDHVLAQAVEAARKETARMQEEARKQIRLEKEAALAALRSQVAILAVDVAEKVLRGELKDKEPQLELVDRLLDEMRSEKQGS